MTSRADDPWPDLPAAAFGDLDVAARVRLLCAFADTAIDHMSAAGPVDSYQVALCRACVRGARALAAGDIDADPQLLDTLRGQGIRRHLLEPPWRLAIDAANGATRWRAGLGVHRLGNARLSELSHETRQLVGADAWAAAVISSLAGGRSGHTRVLDELLAGGNPIGAAARAAALI